MKYIYVYFQMNLIIKPKEICNLFIVHYLFKFFLFDFSM